MRQCLIDYSENYGKRKIEEDEIDYDRRRENIMMGERKYRIRILEDGRM